MEGRAAPSFDTDAIDRAIDADAERAFGFLERLVAQPSVVGAESSAQQVVAEELERLGFTVERLPIPGDIEEREDAGIPSLPYEGRDDVFGVLGPGEGRSLLVGGHIDVVPAEETGPWTSDPFVPTRREGRMFGRGTGDMKGGFAMLSLAIDALRRVAPDAIGGPAPVPERDRGGMHRQRDARLLPGRTARRRGRAGRADRARPAPRGRGHPVARDRDHRQGGTRAIGERGRQSDRRSDPGHRSAPRAGARR